MNRRKFIKAASAIAGMFGVSKAVPALASATPDAEKTSRPLPAGIYFDADDVGPYMVVVQEAVLTSGANWPAISGAIQCVNTKAFLGHAPGTVLLRSCRTYCDTSSPYYVARYEFALASEGWNRRFSFRSAQGDPLYGSADFDLLSWGPTPAEYAMTHAQDPVPVKVKPIA